MPENTLSSIPDETRTEISLNKTQQDTLNDLLPQAIGSRREAAVSGRSGLENMSERSEVAHNDVVVDL